jgi:hypothetical protein
VTAKDVMTVRQMGPKKSESLRLLSDLY